ncbi:DUF6053 domain-containing protein [Lysobacter yananisis]|uniref:DUF6053 domain-containing protein n=1 Tax=Lysobacter yananisis TaxID=1003114 RepID=UPI003CE482E9
MRGGAATGNKSIGPEGPPTKAKSLGARGIGSCGPVRAPPALATAALVRAAPALEDPLLWEGLQPRRFPIRCDNRDNKQEPRT